MGPKEFLHYGKYSFVIFVLRVRSPLRFQARPAETYTRLLWVWKGGGLHLCPHLSSGKRSGKLNLMRWFQLANDLLVDSTSRDLASQLQGRKLWCTVTPRGEAGGHGRKSTDHGVIQTLTVNPDG